MKELSHGSLLQDKKGKLINLSDDYCMKEYVTTDKISLEHKQILFNLRTRMVTVWFNYKNKYKWHRFRRISRTSASMSGSVGKS